MLALLVIEENEEGYGALETATYLDELASDELVLRAESQHTHTHTHAASNQCKNKA